MTEDQQTLLLIKGAISEMPEEQRTKVAAHADQIRTITASPEGLMAFALVGAEKQLEA